MAAISEYLGLVNSAYTSGASLGGQAFFKPGRGYWELTIAQSGAPTVTLVIGGASVLLNDGDALVAEELKTIRFNTPDLNTATFTLTMNASMTIRVAVLEYIEG